MKIQTKALQVTIFVNSSDQWQGQPLYSAIVHLCQQRGLSGASVTRCAEGFGASRQLHTTRLLELAEDLPVRIEIIDLPERINPFLTALEEILAEGLVAISEVQVLRFLSDPKS